MTAIEQLIKIKLGAALKDEKRRVAESLLGEDIAPGNKSEARANKSQAIADMQAKLSLLSQTAAKSKDPKAMKDRIDLMRDKIRVKQQELGMMK